MRDNILIVLVVLILASLCFDTYTKRNQDRYEVISGANMLTILVDKQTGETWRNCICSEKSNVPGCWEKMVTLNPESFNKPTGEAASFKKMLKLQQKQAKLQNNQSVEQPAK